MPLAESAIRVDLIIQQYILNHVNLKLLQTILLKNVTLVHTKTSGVSGNQGKITYAEQCGTPVVNALILP